MNWDVILPALIAAIPATLASIAALIASVAGMLAANKAHDQSKETATAVDGQSEKLMAAVKSSATAEATLAEKGAQHAREEVAQKEKS